MIMTSGGDKVQNARPPSCSKGLWVSIVYVYNDVYSTGHLENAIFLLK